MRQRVLALVNHVSRRQFKVAETGADPETLRANYAPVFLWLTQEHPALVRQLDADDNDNPVQWRLKVQGIATTSDLSRDQMASAITRGASAPVKPLPKSKAPEITRFGS